MLAPLKNIANACSNIRFLYQTGTLGSQDGNADEDVDCKINVYFLLEFCERLDLLRRHTSASA